ncbi:serine-rich adhesin for platelets isoform X2 [Calliphora vicina]|uniref:serine-rich adhesin for platelets isoform X2 n=1 Tax=Calliphora vicina TaxID=7373 RepID=UPI00325A691E
MVDAMKNGVSAIVEYDYTAKEPDELDLLKGDIIHSIKQMPGGWWEGTLQTNSKTGIFPDNFVRVVDMNEDNTVVLRDKSTTSNRRCKVIYSYTQVNDDELSLAVGDVIEFLGEVEEGWWRGRLKNKIGVFPSNFVKLIESSPVFASKRPPSTSTSKQTTKSANNTVTNASSSTVTASSSSSIATAAAATKKINRLSFHNSKEDLLAASTTTTNNSTVAAPISSSLMLGGGGSGDDAAPSLPPKPLRDYCRVEFPYAPQNDDELELKVGDIITIHSMDLPDKGWWKGELRGKIGVFPDNFVKLMAPSEVSPLNDLQQQQSQPQQSHRTTAKLSNTTNTTTTNNLSTTGSTSTNVKSLIKKSGSSSSTQSSNRKDSFGSRDSLNDILSETGLPTGNVAAQRKSLENKNLDLTNASDVAARLALKKQQLQMQQQQQESKTITSSISSNNNNTTTSTTSTLITATSSSSSELRKSMENMDEKTKTTPPPVLNKKPTVPVKKTTTVTSITGNILSGIKQKVKSVESKLTTAASHDYADGVGSSKLSPSYASDSGSGTGGVVMRRAATIAVEDTDFDRVERGSILPDMRAGRVKAPKRRPPSAAINAIGESNNNSLYVNGNGNGSDTTQSGDDQLKSDDNSTGEEQLAKPKPREWEKKKAPWMEELKASQVKKKTSPSVGDGAGAAGTTAMTDRSSKLFAEDVKITNNASSQVTSSMQATNSTTSSSSTSSTKVQSSSVSSTSIMQQSMIVESSSSTSNSSSSSNNTTAKTLTEAMTKSLSAKIANDVLAASNNTSLNSNASGHVVDDVRARPNSLSIRNRSASPSMNATRNILKSSTTAANTSTTTNSASPAEGSSSNTHNSSSTTQSTVAKSTNLNSSSSNHLLNNGGAATTGGPPKIAELESRVDKLELLVHAQQRTIDELVRTLREETDRNKVLRAELDKYAQCVTQV